jgi:hypothetical protein
VTRRGGAHRVQQRETFETYEREGFENLRHPAGGETFGHGDAHAHVPAGLGAQVEGLQRGFAMGRRRRDIAGHGMGAADPVFK